MRAKNMKRALAALLVLLLAVSLLPSSVLATSTPAPAGAPFTSVVAKKDNDSTDYGVSISYEGVEDYSGYGTFADIPHYHISVPANTVSVKVTYSGTAFYMSGTSVVNGYFADIPGWSGGTAQVACTTTEQNGVTITEMTIPLTGCPVTQLNNISSTRDFLYVNNSGTAFAPELDASGDYAPVNYFTFSYESNMPPIVVSNAMATDTVTTNTLWSIDLADFFTDMEDDPLSYSATIDGASQTLVGSVLSTTPATIGEKEVLITANDGTGSTTHKITLNVVAPNNRPQLIANVNAICVDNAVVGVPYILTDLQEGNIFVDPDGTTLDYTNYFYRRSTDLGQNWSNPIYFEPELFGPTVMQLIESVAGEYWYEFKCTDGSLTSTDTWTLKLTVSAVVPNNITFYVGQDQNYGSNSTYPLIKLYETAGFDENQQDYVASYTVGTVTKYIYNPDAHQITLTNNVYYVNDNGQDYPLVGYNPITFTTSNFDGTGTASGTVVSNYNMFYARIPNGRYSFRAYGYNGTSYSNYLGGHSLILPTETESNNTSVYLRLYSVYTPSQKTGGGYFGASDYEAKVFMRAANGYAHHGVAYVSGNYTYYPFMLYNAGNASLYDIIVEPTDNVHYVLNQTSNNTGESGYTALTKSLTIEPGVTLTVTVPTNGDFKLFYQYNNYNTKEITPASSSGNTKTFTIAKSKGNYTWRLTDTTNAKVTKAGYLASTTADVAFSPELSTYTNSGDAHDSSHLGTAVRTRDEAEIQVYLTDSGYLSTTEKTRIRAYRLWQIINSDTANIMIEPTFNYEVLSGNSTDITAVNGGNAKGNWLDVTPTTTDIVAVHYNALEVVDTSGNAGSHGGLFPATNPARTAVFVITNATEGTATATIAYNNNGASSPRPANWDYNYDNWFYLSTDPAPTLDFSVTGASTVEYAIVTTDNSFDSTLSSFTALTPDTGTSNYHASLTGFASTNGGTVIIRMKDSSNHYSYRLARVAKVTATVTNATNPGMEILPGNNVTVTFNGSYRGIYKYSGIFNPTTYYLRYTAGQNEYSATLAQYQQMDKVVLTATIPSGIEFNNATSVQFDLTNGYTYGSMYAAASPFATLYEMTDTGVGTNFSAVGVSFCLNRFPNIPITVYDSSAVADTVLSVTSGGNQLTGYTATVKNSSGTVQQADNNDHYSLTYGVYTYEVLKTGYKPARGSFTVNSNNINSNPLSISIPMTVLTSDMWDGSTLTSMTTNNDGYYEINTGAKLAWFASQVNGGSRSIKGKLTADIDLAGFDWTPIGGGTSSTAYTGIFDGNGKSITGLYINYSSTASAAPYKGLFGYVNGANIHDLTVEGSVTMTSTASVSNAYSGGVVAYSASSTTLTNITSNVTVTVNRVNGNWGYVGGIVGRAAGSTAITNCHNTAAITGYQYTGGITGYADASASITQCSNTGAVTGAASTAGIAGRAMGTMTTSFNNAAVSGTNYVGGLTGYNAKAVSKCYNWGSVTGTGNYVGGITAYSYSANGGVSNCYNAGTVSGGTYAGAVVGYIANSGASMAALYYLNGSCAVGIGRAANTSTQTAASETDTNMKKQAFADSLNVGILPVAFVKYTGHYPILAWQA